MGESVEIKANVHQLTPHIKTYCDQTEVLSIVFKLEENRKFA
jgi:hypothetical protein